MVNPRRSRRCRRLKSKDTCIGGSRTRETDFAMPPCKVHSVLSAVPSTSWPYSKNTDAVGREGEFFVAQMLFCSSAMFGGFQHTLCVIERARKNSAFTLFYYFHRTCIPYLPSTRRVSSPKGWIDPSLSRPQYTTPLATFLISRIGSWPALPHRVDFRPFFFFFSLLIFPRFQQ